MTRNEQNVTSNEQNVTSNEQRAKTNEQRAKNNEQRAKSNEQRPKANEQRAKSFTSFSKIFEKVIFDQLSQYLDKYLNSLFCTFRKAHSSQHALFKLSQAWQEELDKSGFAGTILMDLSTT